MNAISAVVAFLKADSGVAAVVSTRVFGGKLPQSESGNMPRAAIVVQRGGGGLRGTAYQKYSDVRADILCYGRNELEADNVFLAVQDALKQIRSATAGDTILYSATLSAGGFTGTDPDTDWPTCLSSWEVLTAEAAAA